MLAAVLEGPASDVPNSEQEGAVAPPLPTRKKRGKMPDPVAPATLPEVPNMEGLWDNRPGVEPEEAMGTDKLAFAPNKEAALLWAMESWPEMFLNREVTEQHFDQLDALLPPWEPQDADVWWHWTFYCASVVMGEKYVPNVA